MPEPVAQSALTIWGRANSVNVQKVLWCCEELALPFTRIDAGWIFGRNDEPAYLAMNPTGRVPTLVDDDFVLWESNTILRHLARKYAGGERLYPDDLRGRATIDKWLDWTISSYGHVERDLYWGLIRTAPETRDMAAMETIAGRLGTLWHVVESDLGSRPYIAGDTFSLADICLGVYMRRWSRFEGITRPDAPRLSAWYARIMPRAGYQRYLMDPLS